MHAAPDQAAKERYANARTQQQAEAAERDGKTASDELKQALQVPQPLPPIKPTEEEAWERRMAEPMHFQVRAPSFSNKFAAEKKELAGLVIFGFNSIPDYPNGVEQVPYRTSEVS